jgi:hypothetical protein
MGEGLKAHFGMPVLIEFPALEQNLKLCAELKLDFIELNMNLPEYSAHQIDVLKTKEFFEQYGKEAFSPNHKYAYVRRDIFFFAR